VESREIGACIRLAAFDFCISTLLSGGNCGSGPAGPCLYRLCLAQIVNNRGELSVTIALVEAIGYAPQIARAGRAR